MSPLARNTHANTINTILKKDSWQIAQGARVMKDLEEEIRGMLEEEL